MGTNETRVTEQNETDAVFGAEAWRLRSGLTKTVDLVRGLIDDYGLKHKPVPASLIDWMAESIRTKDGYGIGRSEARAYLRNNGVPDANLPRRGRGIGDAAVDALLAGKTNEEALAAVRAEFPHANTTLQSIAWYRDDLRKKGRDLPTSREIQRRREAPAPQHDLALVQTVLQTLGAGGAAAEKLRKAIRDALREDRGPSAIDAFASDLPDETFEGVFDSDRQSGWREVDL